MRRLYRQRLIVNLADMLVPAVTPALSPSMAGRGHDLHGAGETGHVALSGRVCGGSVRPVVSSTSSKDTLLQLIRNTYSTYCTYHGEVGACLCKIPNLELCLQPLFHFSSNSCNSIESPSIQFGILHSPDGHTHTHTQGQLHNLQSVIGNHKTAFTTSGRRSF